MFSSLNVMAMNEAFSKDANPCVHHSETYLSRSMIYSHTLFSCFGYMSFSLEGLWGSVSRLKYYMNYFLQNKVSHMPMKKLQVVKQSYSKPNEYAETDKVIVARFWLGHNKEKLALKRKVELDELTTH